MLCKSSAFVDRRKRKIAIAPIECYSNTSYVYLLLDMYISIVYVFVHIFIYIYMHTSESRVGKKARAQRM